MGGKERGNMERKGKGEGRDVEKGEAKDGCVLSSYLESVEASLLSVIIK